MNNLHVPLSERVDELEADLDTARFIIERLRRAMEKAVTANHLDFAREELLRALREDS